MPWIGQYIRMKHDFFYDSHLEIDKLWILIIIKKKKIKKKSQSHSLKYNILYN